MASIRRKTDENGRLLYAEIRVCFGRRPDGRPDTFSRRFTPEPQWSARVVEQRLAAAAAEFEAGVRHGEIRNRRGEAAAAAQDAAEEQAQYTVERYYREVYSPLALSNLAPGTQYSRRISFDNYILPFFGTMQLPAVTATDIDAFLIRLQSEPGAKGKLLSAGTIHKIHCDLLTFVTYAYRKGVIDRNPGDRAEHAQAAEQLPDWEKSYTPEQVRQILTAADDEDPAYCALIYLALDTGARIGELIALHWSDVDFSVMAIHVHRSLQYAPDVGIYEKSTKTRRSRSVAFSRQTADRLRLLQSGQKITGPQAYVFQQGGRPFLPTGMSRWFAGFGERAGVPHMHAHRLRHTAASIAIQSGADIVSVSRNLGHASVSTTQNTYAHASEQSLRVASDVLHQVLHPEPAAK